MNDKDYALRAEAENGGPELSEEEVGDLLVLLRSAYPAPPPGLKDAVMEKIRAEKTGEARQESAGKILPAADSRKKAMRRAMVRWGALAACVLLVGAVGYKLMPSMTKDMAVADTAMPAAFEEEAFELAEECYADADADDAPEEKEAPPSYAAKSATAGGTGDGAAEPPADAEGGYRTDLNTAATAEMPAAPPMPASEPAAEMEMPANEAYDDAADRLAESLYAADAAYPEAEEAAEVLSAAEILSEADTLSGAEALSEADTLSGAGSDEEAFDEGSLVMKLYTLNGIRYEEREIPVMGSAVMNAAPVLESGNTDSGEAPALTWYYVRTACPHAAAFRNSYHDIPNVLIAKVGPALFASWATKVQSEDLCGVNILSFAVRFGLTAEDLLATGDAWYFLDLPDGIPLTEENAEAVEQYYLNGGDPAKMIPRLVAYELKTAVIREAGLDAYLAWRGGDTALRSWTASEGAAALGISDARLAALFEEALESVRSEYGEEYLPTAAKAYEM